MVSIDVTYIINWRDNDHEKISQFNGGWVLHGRSRDYESNVLFPDVIVSAL